MPWRDSGGAGRWCRNEDMALPGDPGTPFGPRPWTVLSSQHFCSAPSSVQICVISITLFYWKLAEVGLHIFWPPCKLNPHLLVYVVKVTQSCLTLCDPMDLVHGILQARILECVAFPFPDGSSWPRSQTGVSCITGGFFTNWDMREAK